MADVNGTSGNDYIHFDNSTPPAGYNNILYTPDVADIIHGNGGDDIIYDGSVSQIFGDDGNDLIYARYGGSTLYDGGTGFDTLVQGGAYALKIRNVEVLQVKSGQKATLTGLGAQVGETLLVDGLALGPSGDIHLDSIDFRGNVHLVARGGTNLFQAGAGNDSFDLQAFFSGSFYGNDGNDTFNITGVSKYPDYATYFFGGAGTDTLTLNGDYSAAAAFGAFKLSQVERIELMAGFNYTLAPTDIQIKESSLVTVSAATLGAANVLNFDASAETDVAYIVQGGQGDDRLVGGRLDDTLIGNAGDDVLDISNGGVDTVRGGDGDDRIFAGSTLTGPDRINGGAGIDVVELDGTYKGISINSQTLVDVEVLSLVRGHRYTLTSSGSGFGGALLTVDGTALGAGDALNFDGSGELDGRLRLYGGAAADRLTGGALNDLVVGGLGNDFIDLSAGGTETAQGDAGDDRFYMGAALDAKDRLDGGTGMDTVQLTGAYNIQLTAAMLSSIETVELGAGYDYTLSTSNNLVPEDGLLRVDGRSLGTDDVLQFSGSSEFDGRFNLLGGAGDDVLRGGAMNDSFNGGGGADQLIGNAGADRFVYRAVSDSTGPEYDTIFGFGSGDRLVFPTAPSANDPWVKTGTLSTASFNSDLAGAIGADQLGVGHAVRFTADAGTLAGQTFLVADANGVAGYQANEDYVIRLA